MQPRTVITAGLAAAGIAMLLAGCAGPAPGPQVASAGGARPTSTAIDERQWALRFVRCMREHGVELEDPKPGGGFVVTGEQLQDADFAGAEKQCRVDMPAAQQPPPTLAPEVVRQLREFARCMREHGADVPDPGPDGRGSLYLPQEHPGEHIADRVEREAYRACRQLQPPLGSLPGS